MQRDFIRQLMDFRTTYLRAVARASIDIDFRKRLTGRHPEYKKTALELLYGEFHYECPWYMTLKVEDNIRRGPHLNMASGRVMTLPYFGEVITLYLPKKPQFDDKDKKVEAMLQMDALAAYYHQYPWFLQNKTEEPEDVLSKFTKIASENKSLPLVEALAIYHHQQGNSPKEKPPGGSPQVPSNNNSQADQRIGNQEAQGINSLAYKSTFRDPIGIFDGKWSSVDRNLYNLGNSIDDFTSFGAAIFNALALAWDNEMLWSELISYTGGDEEPRARTIKILHEWLGYEYPWEFDLIIKMDTEAVYVPYTETDKPKEIRGKWINNQAPELMLTLPWLAGVDVDVSNKDSPVEKANKTEKAAGIEVEKNQKAPGVALMGLALYNTDGPGYPFTCG